MRLTRVEFVDAVWDALGASGPTDFARKLGLGPDGLQKVRRWRQGGRLDYEDVTLMLAKTGGGFVLDGETKRADDPLAGRLAKLEEEVDALQDGQRKALVGQDALLEMLARIQGTLDARLPAQKRTRQGS